MSSRALVAKNAFLMVLSQLVTNGLSFITLPLLARTLGSTEYGIWWLAVSVSSFAAIFMEAGQDGYASLAVARQRERAAEYLATTSALRFLLTIVILPFLLGATFLLNYDWNTRETILLLFVACMPAYIARGGMSAVRGLEKMGWPAAARIGTEITHTAMLFIGVWMGVRLRGFALIEIFAAVVELSLSAWLIGRLKLGQWRPTMAAAKDLLKGGAPFLLWSGFLILQPSIESVLLSKLASVESVGWYGAANKLSGVLLFPAVIMTGALLPTLTRLKVTNPESYQRAARESLRLALVLGAPTAMGTFLFSDRVIPWIFGPGFEPAAADLKVLSFYLLPLFANITLGTILIISGKQFIWSMMKGVMILISAGLSFWILPYWQHRANNGGIGAAMMVAVGEFGMLTAAVALLPRGLLERSAVLDFLRAVVASAAMAVVAHFVEGFPLVVGLVLAPLGYLAAQVVLGGLGPKDVSFLRDMRRGAIGSGG
jgi:O-antigen/teichoic acid export membrane protein